MSELADALGRLVARGVLTAEQAAAVAAEVPGADPADPAVPAGLLRRLAEIAGYVGGAFVVGATFLFLGQQWEVLGRPGRFAVLAAMALVLFGVGLALWLRGPRDDVRRRLASTLMTGAAGAGGFAAQVVLAGSSTGGEFDRSVLFGGLVALAAVVGGYLIARCAVGQLGIVAAILWVVLAALELAGAQSSRPFGVAVLVVGVAWSGLVWARRVSEPRVGLAIAVTLGLVGAQIAMFGTDSSHYLGHLLTALVAAACFAAYVQLREWVVLAGGVAGATLVVPEFLYDVTDGSLGAAGVMLVAGVTLLGASLAGLRLRSVGAAS
jgi:hypothetical protein